jgi:hypothetical protein
VKELQDLSDASLFDISPPTDQRPFFFNQTRLTRPLVALGIAHGDRPEFGPGAQSAGTLSGHARATINLYIIILFSLAAAAAVVVVPLRAEARAGGAARTAAHTIWFLLIGLGFMLIEISLLQRLSVYLGHPSYGLGVVLFSLVLSTGLGSLLSDRVPLNNDTRRVAWIALTALAAFLAPRAMDAVITNFADAALLLRATLCALMILPIGCLLGFGFPTGMTMAEGKSTAWLWGINGAAGVTGSALAVASNIAFGIDHTMMTGAACYALLLLAVGLKRAR